MSTVQVVISFWFIWAMFTLLRAEYFMVCPPNPIGDLPDNVFVISK